MLATKQITSGSYRFLIEMARAFLFGLLTSNKKYNIIKISKVYHLKKIKYKSLKIKK